MEEKNHPALLTGTAIIGPTIVTLKKIIYPMSKFRLHPAEEDVYVHLDAPITHGHPIMVELVG